MPEATRAYSLRRRLTIIMVGGLMVVLSIIAAALWKYAQDASDKTYDLLLQGASISIQERITQTENGVTIDLPPAALEILALSRQDRVFYRIFLSNGTTITGTPDLPAPPARDFDGSPQFFNSEYLGENVRFSISALALIGVAEAKYVIVQLGQTTNDRHALRFDIFSKGIVGLLVLAIASLFFIRLAITKSMRPLVGIEDDISKRSPTDLSPLRAEPPREIESLIRSINGFMLRLETSKDNAQSFIADVTHQMRTSLSMVEGQLQIASEKKSIDEIQLQVKRAHDEAKKTINLTNQLLAHAMVIHRRDNQLSENVDLRALIRNEIEDVLRSPLGDQVEFQLDVDDITACIVLGDVFAIREALTNIVRNSIQHSDNHCRIVIAIDEFHNGNDDELLLSISDDGPGIKEEEWPLVWERFYKSGKFAGSGIGLAIVYAVMENHAGSVELSKSALGGLKTILHFPIPPNKEQPQ